MQDDRVNTLPTLHAAKDLDVVFIGVIQVVIPLGHEQTRATSAGFSRELLDRMRRQSGICSSAYFHHSVTYQLDSQCRSGTGLNHRRRIRAPMFRRALQRNGIAPPAHGILGITPVSYPQAG